MSDRQRKRLAFATPKDFPGKRRWRNAYMMRPFYAMNLRCSMFFLATCRQARRLGCDYKPNGGQRL